MYFWLASDLKKGDMEISTVIKLFLAFVVILVVILLIKHWGIMANKSLTNSVSNMFKVAKGFGSP